MSLIETARAQFARTEAVEKTLRKDIQEIVRAYRHSWDVYSELIQNSVDAINRRHALLNDPESFLYSSDGPEEVAATSAQDYRGRIKIRVDISASSIEVYDNGVGIPFEKIESFLLPKGGDKLIAREYGFKGFGLTFVAFISTEFSIVSRFFSSSRNEAYELALNGLFDWLADDTDSIPFPSGPIESARAKESDLSEWNTIVSVKLANDYSSRFPAISAAESALILASCGLDPESEGVAEGFEYILRTRTALGNTKPLFSRAPAVAIECELELKLPEKDPILVEIPYSYYHPKDHEEVSIDAYDFADYYERFKRAGAGRSFRGLYHTVSDVIVGERKPIKCDVALAAISSTRLSNIEASLGLDSLDSGDVNITYGVHLAIDGMPTGLRIDDWDMKGNDLKRYYVVVDTELSVSDQLDPGRKGISSYYAKLISNKALELISSVTVEDSDRFARYAAAHLNHGRGWEEGGLPSQDFANKVRESREFEQSDRESDPGLLDFLMRFSTLRRFPREEQEVVTLFFEMLSHKLIKGYATVYVSGSNAPYDAALEYAVEVSGNSYPDDPVGVGQVLVKQLQGKGLATFDHADFHRGRYPELCVDFKASLGRFLEEMRRPSRSSKDPDQLDLLIFWEASVPPAIPTTSYTLDEMNDNQRIFHGTTHRLGLREPSNTEIPCISIKDVLIHHMESEKSNNISL